jgi:serine protease Do
VRDTLFQILERGRPVRGFLGVQVRDLDPSVRSALQYEGGSGAAILGVSPGSPAQEAGLQPWDVVVTYNGETIRSSNQFFDLVRKTAVGDAVALEVWRKGTMIELRAVIAESGSTAAPVQSPQGRIRDPEEILQALGIEVRDLSVPERMRGFRGVVVTTIAEQALAAGKLQAGDLIVAVNNSRIHSANEFFLHLAASAAVQDTTLQIMRAGRSARVTLPAVPRDE